MAIYGLSAKRASDKFLYLVLPKNTVFIEETNVKDAKEVILIKPIFKLPIPCTMFRLLSLLSAKARESESKAQGAGKATAGKLSRRQSSAPYPHPFL